MSATDPTSPTAGALRRLESWPRWRLASLPTPLRTAGRLAGHLGVPHAYVKMDAETGFALGGNKVRKLELELAPHRLEGVTHLITAGGPQSNHCRVTAAAAARLGLGCVLVVQGPEPPRPTGNALLQRLFGAEIHTVARREDRDPGMEEVAAGLRAEGAEPLVVPIGASTG
ncbi:MAG: pyridoxal-phosphate dependent enzyme, partial [Gemmatimonadetes bacterium]|nr:pyridoxal-phosphate dependent enzyme [Gemmatimonadota bacterium]NIQ55640.1 pyridoxal-phosphate dependent enzyme [Gemmatimonadota bacterium]NIU75843.1 pyridoxal-phosphate dependent enzyme [Gammaproteobacteria bacterium]NIX45476.1 pyridoxal-phosphate dependent enzyme [Gemmatimonadota bacterium]NIY09758.1 pyridoxal-phosphate dependent enzyme [Gemmatimonadota bacterium]